jgi:hypothetical protein
MFKLGYPEASLNQCIVFIGTHSTDNQIFSERQITQALKDLDYSRKRGSTVAKQAFTAVNLRKHYMFWNRPYPVGAVGIQRRFLTDVDECGFEIDDANANYGHAVKGLRVRKPGNYGRGKVKITVILAIEPGDPNLPAHVQGSVQRPRRWFRVSTDIGTTTEVYKDYLRHDLFDRMPANEPMRTILHDNLTSHKSPEVVYLIHRRGHRVVCRAPYRPHDGPIEWAFDMLACEIRSRWDRIDSERDLIANVNDVIPTLSGFDDLFAKCGYAP